MLMASYKQVPYVNATKPPWQHSEYSVFGPVFFIVGMGYDGVPLTELGGREATDHSNPSFLVAPIRNVRTIPFCLAHSASAQ